jgi:hypothetical protein
MHTFFKPPPDGLKAFVVSSATIATGVIETNGALLTYYGKDGP